MAQRDEHPIAASSRTARFFLSSLISVLFLAVTLVQAHVKLLWGDEFITFWIGQQKSFQGIWRALASGTDPNPPLMHVLNWWSTTAFGTGPIAVRLSSIVAMGLAVTCLWIYLRRHFAAVYAAAGCLALMSTRGFDYAYDARSYSLLMGFAMAAILLWSLSIPAHGIRRAALLAGMGVALAAGVSSNYYGALAFFPIAAGEFAYAVRTRRWRITPWLAMAAAALPLVACLKLIRLNVAEFGPHAWNKPRLSMVSDSFLIIVEGILWPVLALAVLAFWRRRKKPALQHRPPALPLWEWVAAALLIAYPVIAFLVALCGAGMVSPRCALPVCLGVVIAGTVLLARFASQRRASYVVAVLCLWVLARQAACGVLLLHQRHTFLRFVQNVERAAAPGEPVVVGDSLAVAPLYWYGSPALKEQIVFPVDFGAVHRLQADDSGEQNLWGGRHGVFPFSIDTPAALFREPRERILIAPPDGWIAGDAHHPGITVVDLNVYANWSQMGGVFTPMIHDKTRLIIWAPNVTR